MPSLFGRITGLLSFKAYKDRRFVLTISRMTGQTPNNVELYKLAVCHSSVGKENQSNERLEYLGDAILGAIIAEFLFKKFPYKSEGFLTEIRSRIVNRESLNKLAKKIGLNKIVEYNTNRNVLLSHKSIYGDALEALVGAVYLDKGFKNCKKFVLDKLIFPHFDLDEIVENNTNFKSILIEWAQKENKSLKFIIVDEIGSLHNKEFTAEVLLENQSVSSGKGYSKKKAEQAAAEKACQTLNLIK